MFTVEYVSPMGRVFRLTDPSRGKQLWLRAEGVQGLVGSVEPRAVSSPLVPGHVVSGYNISETAGALQVFITRGERPVGEVYREFLSAFSVWQSGFLRVSSLLTGVRELSVRLSQSVAPPIAQPDALAILDVEVPLVADQGVWWQKVTDGAAAGSGRRTVTVTNPGDVWLWPVVRWLGAGCTVRLPSGAVIDLPTVSQPRRLLLDNAQSCVVLDDDDVVDVALWKTLSPRVLPEGVAPAAAGMYVLTGAASLQWNVGFLSPWR